MKSAYSVTLTVLLLVAYTSLQSQGNDPDISHSRKVTLRMIYKVHPDGVINRARLTVLLPQNIKNRQDVHDLRYDPQPDSIYSFNGNRYALYKLIDLEKKQKLSIEADLTIYKHIAAVNSDTTESLAQWLKAEPYIESESPEIKTVAASLLRSNPIETVVATYHYVNEKIQYRVEKPQGASGALESGFGKCTDFSYLFVALCRANGIPAKCMVGVLVSDDPNIMHAWSEAWLPNSGWILFDPTTSHSGIWQEGKNFKIKIANKYIILSARRNDEHLHNSFPCRYMWQGRPGSKLEVKIETTTAPLF